MEQMLTDRRKVWIRFGFEGFRIVRYLGAIRNRGPDLEIATNVTIARGFSLAHANVAIQVCVK